MPVTSPGRHSGWSGDTVSVCLHSGLAGTLAGSLQTRTLQTLLSGADGLLSGDDDRLGLLGAHRVRTARETLDGLMDCDVQTTHD